MKPKNKGSLINYWNIETLKQKTIHKQLISLISNDLRYLQTHRSGDAQARKGHKIVGFLLSKASKDMQEVLVPMIKPALSAHLAEMQFYTLTTNTTEWAAKWAIWLVLRA